MAELNPDRFAHAAARRIMLLLAETQHAAEEAGRSEIAARYGTSGAPTPALGHFPAQALMLAALTTFQVILDLHIRELPPALQDELRQSAIIKLALARERGADALMKREFWDGFEAVRDLIDSYNLADALIVPGVPSSGSTPGST